MEFEANIGPDPIRVEDDMLIAALENTIASQAREIKRLKSIKPKVETYTTEEFLIRLYAKLGRVYGWKSAYLEASRASGCRMFSANTLLSWQARNAIPDWAVEQIAQMRFNKVPYRRHAPRWSEEEKAFLLGQFFSKPEKSYIKLADMCSHKFGRHITENAIKGSLNRLGKTEPREPEELQLAC